LLRSWRWATSYSSANRPADPHAERVRSNHRAAYFGVPALCGSGQRHREAAQQESPLGIGEFQGLVPVPEPVYVPVLCQIAHGV
jgi:hypothetical protein